jgi:hypothetical protein
MTYEKKLPEQIASHTYKQSRTTQRNQGETIKREQTASPRALQRVVRKAEADPSVAWQAFERRQLQRRQIQRRRNARIETEQRQVVLAPRTFAQTGSWATRGRRRLQKRTLATNHRSAIPPRSRGEQPGKRGLLWRILGIIMGLIGLISITSFALTSDIFRVAQVNVVGTRNETLIRTIHQQGMRGQNIFLLNVPELTARIEALPFVSSASLSKQWPDVLIVSVTERVPVLLWQTPRGTYSVDKQGVVLAPAREMVGVERLKTVVVSVLEQQKAGGQTSQKALAVGTRLPQEDIAFALKIFERLPEITGMKTFTLRYNDTRYANITNGPGTPGRKGSFSVESPDGWIAYLGGVNNTQPLENRLLALHEIVLIAQQRKQQLATVDLRYGLHPVYTVKP